MKNSRDRAKNGHCLKLAFGFRLKLARDRMLLTQSELAWKVTTTPMVVWKWENGRSFPTVALLISLCNVLEVSADYLLGLSPDYTPVAWLPVKAQP